jgi:hypothetical protein
VSLVRSLVALSIATLRRFSRDQRVVQSVLWPIFLTPVTMAITLAVLTSARSPVRVVAIPDTPQSAQLSTALTQAGWTVLPSADPMSSVDGGEVTLGTDGATIWTTASADPTLELDLLLRTRRDAAWSFSPRRMQPDKANLQHIAGLILSPLSLLFVLYALVFSLGALSRDRDEQVLDVEFTLPVPTWLPILARWWAAVVLLVPAHTLSVGILHAMMPSSDPVGFVCRGTGAIAAAAAIGVAVVQGPGVKQGFSGPFAAASIVVAGLFIVGPALPFGTWLPLTSLLTSGPPMPSLVLGLLCGPIGAAIFAIRAGRK